MPGYAAQRFFVSFLQFVQQGLQCAYSLRVAAPAAFELRLHLAELRLQRGPIVRYRQGLREVGVLESTGALE